LEETVPLSEHEQRLLEQMERALYAEDPKLATTLRGGGLRGGNRSRLALGVVAVLSGLGLLLAGVASNIAALGVVGFVVLLAGGWLVMSAFRSPSTDKASAQTNGKPTTAKNAPSQQNDGFMNRVEDRWTRRKDEGGDI